MKRKIITFLSIFGILILILGTTVLMKRNGNIRLNPPGTVGNTAGNLYNGGMFCEDDGYVYFSNPYDNYALYRMRPDETEMEKLIKTQTKSINAAGDYFYYYQTGSGSGSGLGYVVSTTGIYRGSKKNPVDAKCLEKTLSDTMVLIDNSLFYNASNTKTGTSLKKIDIDGNHSKILLDYKITPACVENSRLYFNNTSDNFHLMYLDSANESVHSVLTEDIYMPIVEGDYVYYIDIHNGYALSRYSLLDNTKTVLDEARTDMLNVAGDYVYYQTSSDMPQFKRITKEGTAMEVIADGAYNTFNATSEYIYFLQFSTELPVLKIPTTGEPVISTFDAAKQAALDSFSAE